MLEMEEHSSDSHTHMSTHVELKGWEASQVVDIDYENAEDLVQDGSAEKAVFLDAVANDSEEPD